MGTEVSDYLNQFDGGERAAMEHVYAVGRELAPEAVEGTSYGMAALVYRGKGLIATVRGRNFLSVYPFSGVVVANNLDVLDGFETTTGSIHYSADHQLPDAALRRIIEARREEIDAKTR